MSFLKNIFGLRSGSVKSRNGTSRRPLLCVERLEDRLAPAVVLPAAPVFTGTPISPTEVNLVWNAVPGVSSYQIRAIKNGAWETIGSAGSGSTGIPVTGLSAGGTYSFEVGAANSSGTDWSKAHIVTTFPDAPTAFTAAAASATQVNLTWSAAPGATGYQVREFINGAWKQVASLAGGSTSYHVTGLKAGTTYTFDVGAVNSAGATWSSSHAAATPVNPPAAPSVTAKAVSANQINLAWNPVAGASVYGVRVFINGAWTLLGTVAGGSTTYQVSIPYYLSANTKYTFAVGAANSGGTTWSSSHSATTLKMPPAASSTPINLGAGYPGAGSDDSDWSSYLDDLYGNFDIANPDPSMDDDGGDDTSLGDFDFYS